MLESKRTDKKAYEDMINRLKTNNKDEE